MDWLGMFLHSRSRPAKYTFVASESWQVGTVGCRLLQGALPPPLPAGPGGRASCRAATRKNSTNRNKYRSNLEAKMRFFYSYLGYELGPPENGPGTEIPK